MWYAITRKEVIQQTVEATYLVYTAEQDDGEADAFAKFDRGEYHTRTSTPASALIVLSHEIATVEAREHMVTTVVVGSNSALYEAGKNALLDDLRRNARRLL